MKLDKTFFINFFRTVILSSLVSLFAMKYVLERNVEISNFLPLLAVIIVLIFASMFLVSHRKKSINRNS